MKAAFVSSHGPAESLCIGDMPDPAPPGSSELLVEITFSAVNPIDTYIRSGAVGAKIEAPWIPGCDFAGVILAVGDGVTDFAIGDRVWGSNQSLAGRQGTLAQQISVEHQWVYPIPYGISDEAAAAGALTGITAHLGLHLHGQLQAGETVFVNGGTGGVGSAVIQLAKAAGANVIATVGSPEKEAIAKRLGADMVINYREAEVSQAVQQATHDTAGIDVWFEPLRTPELELTIPLMAKRGRLIVMAGRDARPVLPVGPLYVNDLRVIGFAMFNASPAEQRASADAVNAAAAMGVYQPVIGERFSLDEAARAHRLQEDNTIGGAGTLTGKIIVKINDESS